MSPIGHARNRNPTAADRLRFLCFIHDFIPQARKSTARHNTTLQGENWVRELLCGHPTVFLEETRMSRSTFQRLKRWVEVNERLTSQRNSSMSIEQMLVIFLWMVGHNASNRDAQTRFQHSGRTISKTFKSVLYALLPLYNDFVKPPKNEIPNQLFRTEQQWNKFQEFQSLRGVIDRTHIPASLPPAEKAPYGNRKGSISQNVLAGCTLDMLFFYVLPGWESSAHDARVLKFTLENDPSFPPPSESWVYLADAGYGLKPGVLVPYKKVRYHLREQALAAQQPKTKEELFNLRHAQLRNVIERVFGVLKKRFRIFDTPPQYTFDIQCKLVLVLYALHNFIRILSCGEEDQFYLEADQELQTCGTSRGLAGTVLPTNIEPEPTSRSSGRQRLLPSEAAQYRSSVIKRDEMAQRMWIQYQNYLATTLSHSSGTTA